MIQDIVIDTVGKLGVEGVKYLSDYPYEIDLDIEEKRITFIHDSDFKYDSWEQGLIKINVLSEKMNQMFYMHKDILRDAMGSHVTNNFDSLGDMSYVIRD